MEDKSPENNTWYLSKKCQIKVKVNCADKTVIIKKPETYNSLQKEIYIRDMVSQNHKCNITYQDDDDDSINVCIDNCLALAYQNAYQFGG